VGVIACVLLALLFDLAILGVTRLVTPWQRADRASA
jgi:osmoprotectant transport system permease protein